MQNVSKIYKGGNSKITSTPCKEMTLCNSRVKEECNKNGKCKTMDIVYDWRVTSPNISQVYFGLAEEKWKKRYYNHKNSFNHERFSHEARLSSYVWHLKETLDVTPNLKWSVMRCAIPY